LRQRWLVAAVVLAVYCGGYFAAREGHWLVHRVTVETDCDGNKVFSHWIDRGKPETRAQTAAYWTFTPLRWTEGLVWRVIPRDYDI